MTATILGIVAAVLGFAFWAIKRAVTNADDPKTKRLREKADADAAIAAGAGGVDRVNVQLDDLLRRVQDAGRGDPGGQGSDSTAQGGELRGDERRLSGPASSDAGDPPRAI